MADDQNDDAAGSDQDAGDGGSQDAGDGGGQSTGPDFTSIPEQFLGDDGAPDLNAYRVAYDDLASQKAQRDEYLSALPDKPEGYEFKVPDVEELELPEGFDAEKVKLELKDDDPRITDLKKVAHAHQMPQEAVNDLAKLWAQHEVRDLAAAAQAHREQMEALGPNAESRLDHLSRIVQGRLPKDQATALLNDITSADSMRAIERLLTGSNRQPNGDSPGGRPNIGELSIEERMNLAHQQRASQRGSRR